MTAMLHREYPKVAILAEYFTDDRTLLRTGSLWGLNLVLATLLGTGATGMPQGVESGESARINFIGRKPKMEEAAEPRFANFIARVNSILAAHPAFRRGGNCRFVDGGHPAVIAAFRQGAGTEALGFLVACNFDTRSPQRITIDLAPFLGTDGSISSLELLSNESQTVSYPRLELQLAPCAAQVLQLFRNGERKT